MATFATSIHVAHHLETARRAGRPIVALESTVVAHGLPYPENLATARALESEVVCHGAIPATVGVVAGVPTVGLDAESLDVFASTPDVLKLSRRDIAFAVATKRHGATTVAATMALAALADVSVFATGGIGGVHRGARDTWDVSADLLELSRTPVLVVCAGVKAILDMPATLEYLETAGVPVWGFQCAEFPAFYTAHSGLRVSARVDSVEEAAACWTAHRTYGGGGGALLVVPPPMLPGLDPEALDAAISQALAEADAQGIHGQPVTPFLLRRVAELTGGTSREVNIELLKQNARVAAQVAVALAK